MEWLIKNITQISTLLFSIGVFVYYGQRLLRIGREVKELLEVVGKAFSPDSPGGTAITPDELQAILKEAKDVPLALKELLTKKTKEKT